jgi:hypothetical protein
MNKITAICIASTKGTCLPVMMKSIEEYIPNDIEIYLIHQQDVISWHSRKHIVHLEKNISKSFGEAYNRVCNWAFEKHQNIIICNDDIVFNPSTFELLQHDYNMLCEQIFHERIGYLTARTDYSRGRQNIRCKEENDTMQGLRFASELSIIETDIIAPICAVISKDSWIDFLPINWYSDDVQCLMLKEQKRKNFISRAYVHHVGSQSVGSMQIEHDNAMNYLKAHNYKYYFLLSNGAGND